MKILQKTIRRTQNCLNLKNLPSVLTVTNPINGLMANKPRFAPKAALHKKVAFYCPFAVISRRANRKKMDKISISVKIKIKNER